MNYEEYRWKGIILIVISIICIIMGSSQLVGVEYIFLGAVLSFYGIYWTVKYIEIKSNMKRNLLIK